MSASLKAEFKDFFNFMTVKYFGQQEPRISPTTAGMHVQHVNWFLGYLHKIKGVPLDKLSIAGQFPNNARASVKDTFDYLQRLVHDRKVSPQTEALRIGSIIHMVKFCFRELSTAKPEEGDKAFADILPLKELRKLSRDACARAKTAPPVSSEALKSMSWPDYLNVVEKLRRECTLLTKAGNNRTDSAVASSFQKYLIAAILSSVPDRQRTLRELELGRTLFKDPNGCWVIKHGKED